MHVYTLDFILWHHKVVVITTNFKISDYLSNAVSKSELEKVLFRLKKLLEKIIYKL